MIAIVSSEGEEIKLERPVRAEGSVETWLTSLLQSAQSSLHSIIRNAVSVINDPAFNLLLFLDKMPAQVSIYYTIKKTFLIQNCTFLFILLEIRCLLELFVKNPNKIKIHSTNRKKYILKIIAEDK